MGIQTINDVVDGVKCDDIPWALGAPPPPIEAVDLLTLNPHELIDYARDLQQEVSILRALLHEALAMLHRLTVQGDRARVRIEQLLHELRRTRADLSRFRAIARSHEDA